MDRLSLVGVLCVICSSILFYLYLGWYASDAFKHYSGGIYSEPSCPGGVTHVLLIVGYGVNANGSYWIAKNSWGSSSWGQGGYVLLQRNVNICNFTAWIWSAIIGAPNLSQAVAHPVNCSATVSTFENGAWTPFHTVPVANGCQSCQNGTSHLDSLLRHAPCNVLFSDNTALETCWNGGYETQNCASGSTCVQSADCVASCVGSSPATTTTTTTTTAPPTAASCSASSNGQPVQLPSGCQFCNGELLLHISISNLRVAVRNKISF
jgi:hypothetical protein